MKCRKGISLLPGVGVVAGGAAHLADVVAQDGADQATVARVPQRVTPVKKEIHLKYGCQSKDAEINAHFDSNIQHLSSNPDKPFNIKLSRCYGYYSPVHLRGLAVVTSMRSSASLQMQKWPHIRD